MAEELKATAPADKKTLQNKKNDNETPGDISFLLAPGSLSC